MRLLVILALLAAFTMDEAFSYRSERKKDRRPPSTRKICLSEDEDGSSYRGFVSESAYGNKCLRWNSIRHPWGYSKGLGKHNYCRNPDKWIMPWCYVKKGRRVVKEFCDVPICPHTPTTTTKPPAVVDTEWTCGERTEQKFNKIVNGTFTSIESQPWTAAIFDNKRRRNPHLCGGTLISPCWVLTAAHCFDSSEVYIENLSVHLGKTATKETDAAKEQSFTVERLIIHDDYVEGNFNNDIALLKIRNKDGGCAVRSPSTRAVCLPPANTQLPDGFQCTVAGYGLERTGGKYSNYLKKTNLNLMSTTQCGSYYDKNHPVTDNMICARSPAWNTDACGGDSGGPLVCEASGRMFLFGVVSWGDGCAKKDKPGVYTQVSKYNDWIAEKTTLSTITKGLMYPEK